MSKPILYTFGPSVWATVPELAIRELGYAPDDIERKVVNLAQGENFSPAFLRINPKGTLPTLEADGKAYTSTAEVTSYLVEHAHKRVTPGTSFIAKIHEDRYDPNFPLLLARSEEEIQAKASSFAKDFVQGRQDALGRYSSHPDAAKHQDFYDSKLAGNGFILSVYQAKAAEHAKKAFLQKSTAHWNELNEFISKELPALLPETEFLGGSEPGEDDFHLGAWLARIASVAGGGKEHDGVRALEKGFKGAVHPKVARYWTAWSSRESWQEAYVQGLH
ncbi:hypothetical protein HYDPIDRAFT_124532 [Hydnomerulius pinastri MD-312]|nr:hypothetical protein HYDPIDRAFT_124532 [Hydnomerulius pinastri MD-312]